MSEGYRIRSAEAQADYERCVELQRAVWGMSDLDITSGIQMIATVHSGGLLQLAETPDGTAAGFCYAFPAHQDGRAHLHSHMLAVLPEHRRHGLGARLKWAQREAALTSGIDLITWTFDPLQAGNARLNLARLGAIAREFLENFYGITSSALEHGMPTDRLLAHWELRSSRVADRLAEGEPPRCVPLPDLPRVNDVSWPEGWPVSSEPRLQLSEPSVVFEIPPDWDALCQAAPALARDWQTKVRAALSSHIERGWVVRGFAPAEERGRKRPFYLLERTT